MSAPADNIPEYLETHTVRLCQNLSRVDSLLDLHSFASSLLEQHQQLPTDYRTSDGEPPTVDDILRSATVLLHASLEDCLRTIALAHLPRKPSELLKQIPIVGTGQRPAKVTLSDLTVHSGKTVDSVVEESLNAWLHQQSFNNCADISNMLSHLEIDGGYCNSDFALLEEMISRRHRIVHNADRTAAPAPDAETLLAISASSVQQWRNAVQQFMQRTLYQLHLVVEGDTKTAS